MHFYVALHFYDEFEQSAPNWLYQGQGKDCSGSYLIEEDVYLARDEAGRYSTSSKTVDARHIRSWWHRMNTPRSGAMPRGHVCVFRDESAGRKQFQFWASGVWTRGTGWQRLIQVRAWTEGQAARRGLRGQGRLLAEAYKIIPFVISVLPGITVCSCQ